MLRTHCSITGYALVSADAFTDYIGNKLVPTTHPIFNWSPATLHDFLRSNFIDRKHQIERVLVTHAILKMFGVVEYRAPMLLDSTTKDNSVYINKCFALTVNLFKNNFNILTMDTKRRESTLVKHLPRYRVTGENCDNAADFTNYCERLAEKADYMLSSGLTSEYDAAEDALNFKLAVMGLDSHSIEENDRLPKVFTPAIAEWAACQYALATGAEVGGKEFDNVYKLLTAKVTEKTNIKQVSTLKKVLQDVLPMPVDFEVDKAKSILTLNKVDRIISEHSKLMSELLGTELVEDTATQGGVTWTVITPKKVEHVDNKPQVVRVQDKDQKAKALSLLRKSMIRS